MVLLMNSFFEAFNLFEVASQPLDTLSQKTKKGVGSFFPFSEKGVGSFFPFSEKGPVPFFRFRKKGTVLFVRFFGILVQGSSMSPSKTVVAGPVR